MAAVAAGLEIGPEHLSHPSLFRRPFRDPAWLFEIKLDGFRALARKDSNGVSLTSRNGLSLLRAFPESASALIDLPIDGVFDCELVVAAESSAAGWHELRRRSRMSVPRSILKAALNAPAVLCIFDVLVEAGEDLRPQSQAERKGWLQQSLAQTEFIRVLGQWCGLLRAFRGWPQQRSANGCY